VREGPGGLYGGAMPVSYGGLREATKQRLKANNIAYYEGPDLRGLSKRIARWVGLTAQSGNPKNP